MFLENNPSFSPADMILLSEQGPLKDDTLDLDISGHPSLKEQVGRESKITLFLLPSTAVDSTIELYLKGKGKEEGEGGGRGSGGEREGEKVIKEGYMNKQGGNSRRNWKSRWFVVTNRGMTYYQSADKKERKVKKKKKKKKKKRKKEKKKKKTHPSPPLLPSQGFINWIELEAPPTKFKRSAKRPWTFVLTIPGRDFSIEARTEAEREEWIEAIMGVPVLSHLKKVTLVQSVKKRKQQKMEVIFLDSVYFLI